MKDDNRTERQRRIPDIAEQEHAHVALGKTEEIYRLVVDNMADVITVMDLTLRFTYVSPSVIRLRGYTAEEVMSQTMEQMMTPESLQTVARVFEEELKLETSGTADPARTRILELEEYRKDGSAVWLENHLSALRDDEKKLVGIIALSRDITKRKQAENKIRKQTDAMEAAIDGMALLNENGEYIYLNQAHAAIYGYENAGELIGKSWRTLYHADEIQRFDAEIMPNFGQIGYWQGEARGMKKDGSRFPQEISLTSLASGGLICIVRDITDGRRMEEELICAAREWQMTFDSTNDAICILDQDNRVLRTNKAAERLFNRLGGEMIGKHCWEIVHRTSQPIPQCPVLRVRKSLQRETIDLQEGKRWFEVIADPILDAAGRYSGAVHIISDISVRKHAEAELRDKEERFRAIFERSTVGKSLTATDGNILRVNKAFADMIGYTIEETRHLNFAQITHPDDIAESRECLRILLAGEQTAYRMEKRYIHKSGNIVWADVSTTLLRDDQGTPLHLITSIVDITDHKRVEDELERERTLLRNLIDNVPDRIYAKDCESRFIICNEAMIHRMGKTSINEIVGKSDFDLLPLEMAQRFYADEQAVIQSGISMINREEPLADEDGAITRWNLATKVPLLDKQGNRIGIVGVGREITELKQAQQRLQDTLESLRKAVGTTIQVMVSAVEARDPYTAGHQIRSAGLARAIATEMGLSPEKIDGIRMAGSIHDIGKLAIPAEILSKPTKLSDVEFRLIKEHAQQGYEILKDVESPWPLAEIVHQHHERMDGSGYPRNLKGEEILIEARILAVADVVEAMASHRPYRPGLGIEAALDEIEKNRDIVYDSVVADACLRLFREKGFHLESI